LYMRFSLVRFHKRNPKSDPSGFYNRTWNW